MGRAPVIAATIRSRVPYKWLVATAFVFGLFMDLLDTTIVNVALPEIGRELHASNTTIQWVVSGYLLSLAVWIPASGWIGDRFGTKRTFLFALGMFSAGSALCGFAPSIGTLIFFRVLQGVGGGMLTPVGTAMLFRAFPPNERARASAVLAVPTTVAPAIGPVLGGFLVDAASWHWIFYINVPIGLLGIVFAAVFLHEHIEPTAGRFDIRGFIASGAALALIVYALSEAPNRGWLSPVVVGSAALGVIFAVYLAWAELRQPAPMLDLRLFRDRMFRNANLAALPIFAALLGVLFLLPLYLQQLRGLSAIQSGLATFPQAIGLLLTVRFVSRLYPRIGPRRLLAGGSLAIALITAGFLFLGIDTSLWSVRALMLLRGCALGATAVPLQAATFATISAADTGRASSLFSTTRQVGSSLGVAILATTLASETNRNLARLGPGASVAAQAHAALLAFHSAFLASLILALVAAAFALLIHDEDAAATLAPRPRRKRSMAGAACACTAGAPAAAATAATATGSP